METKQQQSTAISIESIVESITLASIQQTADTVESGFENMAENSSMIMIAFD